MKTLKHGLELKSFPLEIKEDDPDRKDNPPALDLKAMKTAWDGFMKTFEEFKSKNDQELAELKKKGSADVVTRDEVKKINDALTEQQKKLDEIRLEQKRTPIETPEIEVGGVKRRMTEDEVKHRTAFLNWMRTDEKSDLRQLEQKALSVGTSPDGGYLVPHTTETAIDRVLSQVSPIRAISTVRTIGGGQYKKPVNLAGTGYGWVGETGARTETDTPELDELAFDAMELYAQPAATQNLLDDAVVDMEAWLASEVDIVFAEQEGAAFVNGNGVNKPKGFLSYTTVANDSWSWGKIGYVVSGVAAALSDGTHNGVDAIIDLVYAVKAGYRQNANFVMNRKTQAAVRKLKDSNDQYLWQPGAQAGQPAQLLGFSITEAEDMPDIEANAFPIAFGDFRRGYLVVDRQGIRVLRDPYSSKPYVLFYTTKRVGGGVQHFEPIKLLKISA